MQFPNLSFTTRGLCGCVCMHVCFVCLCLSISESVSGCECVCVCVSVCEWVSAWVCMRACVLCVSVCEWVSAWVWRRVYVHDEVAVIRTSSALDWAVLLVRITLTGGQRRGTKMEKVCVCAEREKEKEREIERKRERCVPVKTMLKHWVERMLANNTYPASHENLPWSHRAVLQQEITPDSFTLQSHNTIHHNKLQHNTTHRITTHFKTLHHNTVQVNTPQSAATQHNNTIIITILYAFSRCFHPKGFRGGSEPATSWSAVRCSQYWADTDPHDHNCTTYPKEKQFLNRTWNGHSTSAPKSHNETQL